MRRRTGGFPHQKGTRFGSGYHLKDWLKNDPASAVAVADVEDMISGTPSLGLCADLANGSKHLKLTRHRTDPETAIGARHYDLRLGGGEPEISVKYEVHAAGTTHDAYTLALQCWQDWQTYLVAKGLIDAPRTL